MTVGEAAADEPILEPELPIVDAHHHLWCLRESALKAREGRNTILERALGPILHRRARYLFDELMADFASGHNIRASVFVDAHAMYRSNGAAVMRSVGEVEFANGVAAMAASGTFGETRACAAIVGGVDLRVDAVEAVLDAHLRAGGARYRGVRCPDTHYDEDSSIVGAGPNRPHVLLDPRFRSGFKWLHSMGLSFDVWLLEPQLPDLIDLARTFPETQIILDHVGGPVGVGRYGGQREARFSHWRDSIRALASCGNVAVKLGGLGVPLPGFKSYLADPPATSHELAQEWRPYIETCIEAFGVHRCMFESNFPIDAATCSYAVVWNTFKRLTAGASQDEKTALYSGTAMRLYGLSLE